MACVQVQQPGAANATKLHKPLQEDVNIQHLNTLHTNKWHHRTRPRSSQHLIMRQAIISQDFLLIPSNDVRIGRLVLNARQPHLHFLDPPDIEEIDITDAPQKNCNEIMFKQSASSIKAVVSKIAEWKFGKGDNDNFRVSTLKAHAYRMQNSGA